jgi:basic amino acid/polyamine antiporter, APA family
MKLRGRRLPVLETPEGLRRGLGSPALFGIAQGFTAASIYFAIGLIVERAHALTWAVLLAAAGFFLLLVLSYVEGTSLHKERGGATVLARYGFNELWSFVAGWAILLDYLILIALCAFATTDYLAVFWHRLSNGLPEFLVAAGVILYVALANARGAGPRRYDRAALIVLADLALQLLLVVLGLALLFEPDVLAHPAQIASVPPADDLLFAFTLAIIAFAGLDASSGLAGQVAVSRKGLKRLIAVRIPAAIVPYVGIGLVASSVLPQKAGQEQTLEAPVLAIVNTFQQAWLRDPLRYLVGISAFAVLVVACNAAMLGLSRLGYSLALNRQVPSLVGRLHPRFATPVVIIGIGSLLAIALVIPGDLEFLGGIYAFGATLAFTLVHLSVIRLRWREPDLDRPYKMPFNVRLGRGELPLTAALGALVSAVAFVSVITFHGGARIVGLGWMAFGITLYVVYRTTEGKSVFQRVTIPERALTHREEGAEYGSILVPVLGTAMDDDIMQTAGRLAADEGDDFDEGGPVIEALWVFEVPMALPIDARVPEDELKRARAALARAKAVGEEYENVEVATATVRARRAGEAIVHEARRRGVEAIVLAAEEPTRMRGGPLLGGKRGLRDTFVGETTRYVITKAPCRVILTAPPAVDGKKAVVDPTRPVEEHREVPQGHPVAPGTHPALPIPARPWGPNAPTRGGGISDRSVAVAPARGGDSDGDPSAAGR